MQFFCSDWEVLMVYVSFTPPSTLEFNPEKEVGAQI